MFWLGGTLFTLLSLVSSSVQAQSAPSIDFSGYGCAQLLTNSRSDQLSHFANSYLSLVAALSEKNALSPAEIAKLIELERPTNPVDFASDRLAAEQKHALRKAFERLISNITNEWPRIKPHLKLLREKMVKAAETKQRAQQNTEPLFVATPLKIIEKLENTPKEIHSSQFYNSGSGTLLYAHVRGPKPAFESTEGSVALLTNLTTRKTIRLPLGDIARFHGFYETPGRLILLASDKQGIKLLDAVNGELIWEFAIPGDANDLTTSDPYTNNFLDRTLALFQKNAGEFGIIAEYHDRRYMEIPIPKRSGIIEIDSSTKEASLKRLPPGMFEVFASSNLSRIYSAGVAQSAKSFRFQVRELTGSNRVLLNAKLPVGTTADDAFRSISYGETENGFPLIALHFGQLLWIYNGETRGIQKYGDVFGYGAEQPLGFVRGSKGEVWFVSEMNRGSFTVIDVHLEKLRTIEAPFLTIAGLSYHLLKTSDGKALIVTQNGPHPNSRHSTFVDVINIADGSIQSVQGQRSSRFHGPAGAYLSPEGWWNVFFDVDGEIVPYQVFGPTAGH